MAISRPDRGGEGLHRVGQVERLATQQDQVERLAQTVSQDRWRRLVDIAARATDRQSRARQLLCAARTNQKGHVAAGLKQPAAKIAADGAGADDQGAHDFHPLVFRGDHAV